MGFLKRLFGASLRVRVTAFQAGDLLVDLASRDLPEAFRSLGLPVPEDGGGSAEIVLGRLYMSTLAVEGVLPPALAFEVLEQMRQSFVHSYRAMQPDLSEDEVSRYYAHRLIEYADTLNEEKQKEGAHPVQQLGRTFAQNVAGRDIEDFRVWIAAATQLVSYKELVAETVAKLRVVAK